MNLPPARKYDNANPGAGYVYVIHPVGVEAYKIGYSVNLLQRLAKLQSGKDYQLEYVTWVWSDNAYHLEFMLHQRFKRQHLSGEWFALKPDDVEYIRGLAR